MKKYKVISLSLDGLGNKIFNFGDIVKESNFPKRNAEKLVQQDFLREIVEDLPSEVSDVVVAPEFESVTKAMLLEKLTADGKEFNERANKQELYDLAYPPLTEEQIIAANKAAAISAEQI